MIYAYDTEFLEDGRTIELISIGIVAEDGREYYAVNSDAAWDEIHRHPWLCENVVPSLPLTRPITKPSFGSDRYSFAIDTRDTRVKPHWVIANEVREFLLAVGPPKLWADYGAYDHIALCQLFGRMINLPPGIPMFTHDLQQMVSVHSYNIPEQESGQHNALEDARHVMRVLRKWRIASHTNQPADQPDQESDQLVDQRDQGADGHPEAATHQEAN